MTSLDCSRRPGQAKSILPGSSVTATSWFGQFEQLSNLTDTPGNAILRAYLANMAEPGSVVPRNPDFDMASLRFIDRNGGTLAPELQSKLGLRLFDALELVNVERGGAGADLFGVIADHLDGRGGANVLRGFAGEDRLDGGRGGDRIYGGRGTTSCPAVPARIVSMARAAPTASASAVSPTPAPAGPRRDPRLLPRPRRHRAVGDRRRHRPDGQPGLQLHRRRPHSTGRRSGSGGVVSGDVDGDGRADFEIGLDAVSTLTGADFVL